MALQVQERCLPKATRSQTRPSDLEQSKRFIEAARELECDDDKDRFEKRLGKIAKAKPKDSPPKRGR